MFPNDQRGTKKKTHQFILFIFLPLNKVEKRQIKVFEKLDIEIFLRRIKWEVYVESLTSAASRVVFDRKNADGWVLRFRSISIIFNMSTKTLKTWNRQQNELQYSFDIIAVLRIAFLYIIAFRISF